MKEELGKHIDNLFKKRLEDAGHQLDYNEADWDALEQMLDRGKKRRGVVFWLPMLSGVAALLLLVFGWWFFKPATVVNTKDNKQQAAVRPAQPIKGHPGTSGGAIQQPNTIGRDTTPPHPVNNIAAGKQADKNKSFFTLSADGAGRNAAGKTISTTKGTINNVAVAPTQSVQQPVTNIAQVPVPDPVKTDAANATAGTNTIAVNTEPNATVPATTEATPAAEKPVKKKVKAFSPARPQYALTVLASSDLNGVSSFNEGKVGSNFGALVSVGIKKWTITSGAVYSIKPYMTAFSNYTTSYQFKQDPQSVTADCRMLDIPINVGYQVYKGGKNKFSLGTGLSSYFMLHENYKYNYSPATSGPANYIVKSPKNYLLSNLNLNATFEHQLNSKFSVSVQPYMKVPLKAVGYSQVNLQSAGVAVGFNWNINSFTKP